MTHETERAEYLIIHRDIVDMIEDYLARKDVGYLCQALKIELDFDVQKQRRNVIAREMEVAKCTPKTNAKE